MADPVTGIRWLPPDNYKSLHEEAIAASGGQITFAHFRRIHLRHFPEYVMLRGKRKEKCDDCMMFFKQLTKTLALTSVGNGNGLGGTIWSKCGKSGDDTGRARKWLTEALGSCQWLLTVSFSHVIHNT